MAINMIDLGRLVTASTNRGWQKQCYMTSEARPEKATSLLLVLRMFAGGCVTSTSEVQLLADSHTQALWLTAQLSSELTASLHCGHVSEP